MAAPCGFARVVPICPFCGVALGAKPAVDALGKWYDVKCEDCHTLFRARWEVPLDPEAEKPRDAKRKS